MGQAISNIEELRIDTLVPFSECEQQVYKNNLNHILGHIDNERPVKPIVVRPINEGKYEVICSYSRIPTMRELGCVVIQADVRRGLSDDDALELFYESHLDAKSFLELNYANRFRVIQYSERLIRENSRQGQRTDLKRKETLDKHKLNRSCRVVPTRDWMAKCLGISTTIFSKYRRIAKLPNEQLESVARLLEEKKITLEIAYEISMLESGDINGLVRCIDKSPSKKVDKEKLY